MANSQKAQHTTRKRVDLINFIIDATADQEMSRRFLKCATAVAIQKFFEKEGYYDIPLIMEKFNIKGCINMVPALIEQIEDYVNNKATDRWNDLTLKDVSQMKIEEEA